MNDEELEIALDEIDIPKLLMRDEGEDGGLQELADSIKAEGLINAITIRLKGKRYELVAGWRRLKAHGLIPWTKVRCKVKKLTDEQALAVMAAENLFREDVDPVDEALFIGRLMDSGTYKEEDLARMFHRSREWIVDRLTILSYPDYLIAYLKQRRIPLGVAKLLGAIRDEVYRHMYVDAAAQYGTTVAQADYLFKQWDAGLLSPTETIIPPDNADGPSEPPKVQATCKKCGGNAVAPNLSSVFVHLECPAKTEEKEEEKDGPKSENEK